MNNSSNVVIGGYILNEIEEIKYLGVIIDNKITLIPHIYIPLSDILYKSLG